LEIVEMTIADYKEAVALWRSVGGIGLHDDVDSKEGIAEYLKRNPDSSFVAREDGELTGTILCGHDGRRGYLHHLAVAQAYRKQGIGKALVERAINQLGSIGIAQCHVFVFAENLAGQKFWKQIGWAGRDDMKIMSKDIDWKNLADQKIRIIAGVRNGTVR
jgi:ribosomal protein S18 acetylase RimI-like enzyme